MRSRLPEVLPFHRRLQEPRELGRGALEAVQHLGRGERWPARCSSHPLDLLRDSILIQPPLVDEELVHSVDEQP